MTLSLSLSFSFGLSLRAFPKHLTDWALACLCRFTYGLFSFSQCVCVCVCLFVQLRYINGTLPPSEIAAAGGGRQCSGLQQPPAPAVNSREQVKLHSDSKRQIEKEGGRRRDKSGAH